MQSRRPEYRAGFTIIELLVVISVMTLLLSLVVMAVPRILNTTRIASTKATIKKVNGLLTKRMDAISREIQDQEDQTIPGSPSYRTDFGTPSPYTLDQAKLLGRKQFMMRHCPQSYVDGVGEWPATVGDFSGGSSTELAQRAQSSEAMYIFLIQGKQFDAAPIDSESFRSTELADTDGDGYMEIVDGWGQPLRFYRWPTRLIRPSATQAAVATEAQNAFNVTPGSPANVLIPSLPAKFMPWQASTQYQPGQFVVPSVDIGFIYQCQTAGTSNAAEPAWPMAPNLQVTDGGAVWTTVVNTLAVDPDDTLGAAGNLVGEESSIGSSSVVMMHTANTWHSPLIVSAGGDGELGLYEPNDNFYGYLAQPKFDATGTAFQMDELFDNLTNRQE